MHTIPASIRYLVLSVAGLLLLSIGAPAVNADELTDAQARYREDMAACNAGQSNQDIATCRLEARNALAEARRGRLNVSPPPQFQQNALQRCEVHQDGDRADCEARMRGEGRVEGSVESGAILRESVRIIPGQ